ncbi:MAG: LEA type 2 family protein [Deltaproteobacteria bacterium]|nr:LEA type 2 family protein [Deltaproteobacteria bacterium]
MSRCLPLRCTLGALALALASSCATPSKPAPESMEEAGAPVSAETLRIEERDQTISSLRAVVTVRLKNEGTAAVSATRARFEVVTAGKVVHSGEVPLAQVVPAAGEATVEVCAPFVFAEGDEAIAALVERKEPVEYALRGIIEVGGAQVEFAKAAAIRAPRMPILKLSSLDAATSPSIGVAVTAMIDLENPNTFPLVLRGSSWKLTVAGKLAGEGVMERQAPKPASHTTSPIEVVIAPNEVKQRKELQGATVPYELQAELDLGAAKVRLEQSGETRLLRAGD